MSAQLDPTLVHNKPQGTVGDQTREGAKVFHRILDLTGAVFPYGPLFIFTHLKTNNMDTLIMVLLYLLIAYVMVELLFSVMSRVDFILARTIGPWIAETILGKKSCHVGVHKWKITRKKIPIRIGGGRIGDTVEYIQRECRHCPKKQYKPNVLINEDWKDGEITENSAIVSRNI